jgi:hypothetical protein
MYIIVIAVTKKIDTIDYHLCFYDVETFVIDHIDHQLCLLFEQSLGT